MAAYPAWQATIVTEAGDIQPGAQVDVVLESTGLVPAGGIWSNRAGSSALANPFFADANGFAQFYAAPGEYRITATGVGGTRVWRYVVLDGTAATKDTGTAADQLPKNSDLTAQFAAKAPLASPALTGTPTAPTATAGTNTTQLATTAFVTAAGNLKAPLASPALTGTPTAPTAAAGTNTAQLATTAFVKAKSELDSIGVGQTWQDVTGSRGNGTTYTNTTGKPIFINLYGIGTGSNCSVSVVVDSIVSCADADSLAGYPLAASGLVPNGSTFKYNWSNTGSIKLTELR